MLVLLMGLFAIIMFLLALIIPIIILVYVIKLENPKCGCINDWRNSFIKWWTITTIVLIGFMAATHFSHPLLSMLIASMNIVNAYALFTYVGDINSKECKCATENLEYINDFLYYWRFVVVILCGLGFIGALTHLVMPSRYGSTESNVKIESFETPSHVEKSSSHKSSSHKSKKH